MAWAGAIYGNGFVAPFQSVLDGIQFFEWFCFVEFELKLFVMAFYRGIIVADRAQAIVGRMKSLIAGHARVAGEPVLRRTVGNVPGWSRG